jgi:hypothetical protein
MPRRLYTYPDHLGWGAWNMTETVGSYMLTVGILISIVNFVRSRRGPLAPDNPWNAGTLEWDTASPPAVYGSDVVPVVATRLPLWDEFDEEDDPAGERALDDQRVAAVSSVLDAEPLGVAKMAEDTLTPLLMALALTALFATILLKLLWLGAAGLVVCALVTAGWLWPEPERDVA